MPRRNRAKYTVRPAKPEDGLKLAPKLRAIDAVECFAVTGLPPEDSCLSPFAIAVQEEAFTLRINGKVEAMGGVTFDPYSHVGIPWFLSSDKALKDNRGITFLRTAKRKVDEWTRKYGMLTNAVSARNAEHIKWIEWLGFEFTRTLPVGPFKTPFIIFERHE